VDTKPESFDGGFQIFDNLLCENVEVGEIVRFLEASVSESE